MTATAYNTKYEVIIFFSETDNSFIAEVPELAGCMHGRFIPPHQATISTTFQSLS